LKKWISLFSLAMQAEHSMGKCLLDMSYTNKDTFSAQFIEEQADNATRGTESFKIKLSFY
jgi:hypothetical protein